MAGSSRTPLSQLCQQKSAPCGTVTTDLTLQVESHKDATVDIAPTRALLADVPCVLTACVGANHTHHFRTQQHTIVEERDYRAYSPPDVLISVAPAAAPLHTSPTLTILACQCSICQLPRALRMEEGPDLGRPSCLVKNFSFLRWWLPLQKKECKKH